MDQLIVQSTPSVTRSALAAIAANASFLWERLDGKQYLPDINAADEQEIQTQCERWCQVLGSKDTLQKRLSWDDLDLDSLTTLLGPVKFHATQPLPEWVVTLEQIIQAATNFQAEQETFLPIDSEQAVPFEDILLPAVKVARQKLLTQLDVLHLHSGHLPLSLLSQSAYRDLERGLLKRLSGLCSKTLNFEFSQIRPFGQNLFNLLGLEAKGSSKTHYTKFVAQLLQDGLLTLFQKYPVLGRLVATAVNFWVEFIAEFLEHLTQDAAEIQQIFGSQTHDLGKVAEIQGSLSDAHNRGRTVISLAFESGLKLIYKPKDLSLEIAFNQLLVWCNQQSQLLELKVIQILARPGYGWVEYVPHLPCKDEAAAERFYQRAGMLLCLIYALRGTDCHRENLVASSEHLVLIDMETLLHHEANSIADTPDNQAIETAADQQLWDSVLRTGLLPRWDFSSDRRSAYDISGLGSYNAGQASQVVPQWVFVNTDDMQLRSGSITASIYRNVPCIGDVPISPNAYQAHITAGFEQMYRFLVAQKDTLLAPQSLLTAIQELQVRFVFRPTRIYSILAQKVLAPDYLRRGVDYSIQLDYLTHALLVAQDRPNAWPIVSAELRAMEQLDIPFFTANVASEDLKVRSDSTILQYFKLPSYQQVRNQFEAMSETDLAYQIAIIQGSFQAKVAQTTSELGQEQALESLPLLTAEQWIEEAKAIATVLEKTAIPDPSGGINWIGLSYVVEAERFRLQVLNHSLYDGNCGIALFLAALAQVTGESRFANLSLRTLQSLRQTIHQLDPDAQQRVARFMGIGGAVGVGSLIYALVKVSEFLNDPALLSDAQTLNDWITPELIAADQKLDVMSGAAGAILGLLALYQSTQEAKVLEKAIACGQHLLTHRVSDGGGPRAWKTLSQKPLTGFSHGAAGICYALLRLYAVTQEQAYYTAAWEGIEYERSVFSESQANWPDFRSVDFNQPPSFPIVWCHGAAGIGLGRLGALGLAALPGIEREIEIALQTTQSHGLDAGDHLCCGNLGRAEVLLVGAQRCSRSDWHQGALHNTTNVVARAKRIGSYQMFTNLTSSVFHPSFFRGTAGIGYQLLRLSAPEQLPSVLLWE